MTNNYNLELIKERIEEDKYTVKYGNIHLPEELIVEAYESLRERKSLERDAKILKFTKDICDDIRKKYPNILLKIQRFVDDYTSYESYEISYFVHYNEDYSEEIDECFMGELSMKYYDSDKHICCIWDSHDIKSVQGEYYEE